MYYGITLDKYDKGKAKNHLSYIVRGLQSVNIEVDYKDIDKIHEVKKDDILIIYGLIRGSDVALKYCWDNKIKYLYYDNSYFNNFTQKMFRLVPNACHPQKFIPVENPKFKIPYKKLVKKNGHILVIPPSDTIQKLFNRTEWLDNTNNILDKYTDKNIVVRTKPSVLTMKLKKGKLTNNKTFHIHDIKLEDHFKESYCVVADTSSVAVLALINGIPVISHKDGPVGCITENNISNINLVNLPNKDKLKKRINQLTHYCFTIKELKSGKFYTHMLKFGLWDF